MREGGDQEGASKGLGEGGERDVLFGFGLDEGELEQDVGIPCSPSITVHGPAPLKMSCTRHMFSAGPVRGSAEHVELWLARRLSTVSPQSLHSQLCLSFVYVYG